MKRIFLVWMLVASMVVLIPGHGKAQVDYQKYGRVATAVVKEDFPGQMIREYQYMGRQKASETDVTDSFLFQVIQDEKPLNVTVKITHNIKNNKLLSLTVTEQPR